MNRSRPSRAKVKARRTRASRRHFRATLGKSRILEEPEETFDQPKPKRQADYDAEDETDPDKRKADSAFDDLYIEVDESELESELHGPPPDRKTYKTIAGPGRADLPEFVARLRSQHVNARDAATGAGSGVILVRRPR